MKAIILAAGIGSRLRPITNKVPKCLVEVNGKSIIEYQIDAYIYAGVTEIIIITGYLQEKLVKHLVDKYPKLNIKFINNENYESTNNMYSLYLAKKFINNKFVMSNADVVFSIDMVKKLIDDTSNNLIAVDYKNYNEESMKIEVNENRITAISKQITQNIAYGSSIDLYKFGEKAKEEMFKEIERVINGEGNLNSWTEVALNSILDKVTFKPFNIEHRFWYEIDNHDDLKYAEKIVKESINYGKK